MLRFKNALDHLPMAVGRKAWSVESTCLKWAASAAYFLPATPVDDTEVGRETTAKEKRSTLCF
jgi:hypothetical protein